MINTIRKSDPTFMASECLELLGDLENSEKVKNYKQALEYYREASSLKSNKLEIYIKIGMTSEKLRDYEDAISNYKKALRRNKNHFESLFLLGKVCIKSNHLKEGMEALIRANKIDPNNLNCMLKLGELYSRDYSTLQDAEKYLK